MLAAITDVWQDNLRYRLSRAKSRIKFLVDDYGPEGVREMVEERLGRKLEDFRAPDPVPGGNHLGIHRQKQEGFYYAGFPVPSGRVTGTQLRQIADILEPSAATSASRASRTSSWVTFRKIGSTGCSTRCGPWASPSNAIGSTAPRRPAPATSSATTPSPKPRKSSTKSSPSWKPTSATKCRI
ncbi:hypothetical protein [Rhodothermus marinus]|uniref:hypothetical protein n=1 Tax=Rhodothermus marinus TaxID=29549 RepID=UPI000B2536F8